MPTVKTSDSKRRVTRLTLEQLLDFHIFKKVWKEVDVGNAFRVIKDGKTGKDVGLEPAGMSIGYSIEGAAETLKVSKQRVYKLLNDGILEGYELLDDAKKPSVLLITPASLLEFKNSPHRRSGPKPKAVESSPVEKNLARPRKRGKAK